VFFLSCFTPGTVVLGESATVTIRQRAELVPALDEGEPAIGIMVHVIVHCGDGETILGGIEVAARQGDFASNNIDGIPGSEREEIEVFIPGPFVEGEGQASALLQCGPLFAAQDLGKIIRIVE
jgi:hypothetical protein